LMGLLTNQCPVNFLTQALIKLASNKEHCRGERDKFSLHHFAAIVMLPRKLGSCSCMCARRVECALSGKKFQKRAFEKHWEILI
jgi:hypothetical protein